MARGGSGVWVASIGSGRDQVEDMVNVFHREQAGGGVSPGQRMRGRALSGCAAYTYFTATAGWIPKR